MWFSMTHLVNLFKKRFSREKYEKEIEAVREENDSGRLAEFALHSDFSNVRLEATNRIDDESVLADIARNDSNKKVRMVAIGRIHNEFVLKDLSSNDSSKSIRHASSQRLGELGHRWNFPINFYLLKFNC